MTVGELIDRLSALGRYKEAILCVDDEHGHYAAVGRTEDIGGEDLFCMGYNHGTIQPDTEENRALGGVGAVVISE